MLVISGSSMNWLGPAVVYCVYRLTIYDSTVVAGKFSDVLVKTIVYSPYGLTIYDVQRIKRG